MIQRVLILNFPKIQIEAPPLAAALLCAICDKNKIQYDFVDCNLEMFKQLDPVLKEEILGLFAERLVTTMSPRAQAWIDQYFSNLADRCKSYDLIAISVFSYHSISLTTEFLSKHRHKFSGKVVIGGAGIVLEVGEKQEKFYDHLKSHSLIDYWVLGEGEHGFEDVLLNRLPSASVNNVDFNNLEGFQAVPSPNLDKFDLESYRYRGKRIVGVEGSRGCVKKCTFCDIQKTWGAYKYKDGQQLAEELLALKKRYDIDHFWFNDSLINGSLKAFRDFIKHLSANRNNDFTWSSQAIVRPISSRDEDDFRMMKDSGCETLALGIESFSQPVRFHMGKKFTDADLDHFFELAQKYNISLFLLMIVGYPTETQKDFDRTIEQLEKYQYLADDGTIAGLRIGPTMSMIPGTPIYDMQDDLGIKYDQRKEYKAVNWILGENTLKKRVEWRTQIEDRAVELGYNCADKEMRIEETLIKFLKGLDQ